MTTQHKVGNVHHYGLIIADAYMWDKSGQTVTLYYNMANDGYVLVQWHENGQYEILSENYDNYEEAAKSYISRTFGVEV